MAMQIIETPPVSQAAKSALEEFGDLIPAPAIHMVPVGKDPMRARPDELTFHKQTRSLHEKAFFHALKKAQETGKCAKLEGLTGEELQLIAQRCHVEYDIRTPHEECNVNLIKAFKKKGFRFVKAGVSELHRKFIESRTLDNANKRIVEGQDDTLQGHQFRKNKMTSKAAALDAAQNEFRGFRRLRGNARAAYNKTYSKYMRKGGKKELMLGGIAKQKTHLKDAISANAYKFFKLSADAGLDLNNQDQFLRSDLVIKLLRELGVRLPRKRIIGVGISDIQRDRLPRSVGALKAYLLKETSIGEPVWAVVQGLQIVEARKEEIYASIGDDSLALQDNEVMDYSGIRKGEPLSETDLKKAVEIITDRELDRDEYVKTIKKMKEINRGGIARFSGNANNLGFYGDENQDLDPSRGSALRIAMRMTNMRAIVEEIQGRIDQGRIDIGDTQDLSDYINRIPVAAVKEFLEIMGVEMKEGDNIHQILILHVQNTPASLDILSNTYFKAVKGVCGTMQALAHTLGLSLSAIQHLTGLTTLYSFFCGDFNEVCGLQSDKSSRTYKKIESAHLLEEIRHSISAHHLVEHEGEFYFPTDAVHSQLVLKTLGSEGEGTRMLRIMMSDIDPDLESLEMKLPAHASKQHGDDRPYTQYNGEKIKAYSRFEQDPHLIDAPENATQRAMIVNEIEVIRESSITGRKELIMAASQDHDDATRGDLPHRDYVDDTTLKDVESFNDGANRTKLYYAAKKSVFEHLGLALEQPELEQPEIMDFDLDQGFNLEASGEVDPSDTESKSSIDIADLKTLEKQLKSFLFQTSIRTDDIQRNFSLFKAVTYWSSSEARLMQLLSGSESLDNADVQKNLEIVFSGEWDIDDIVSRIISKIKDQPELVPDLKVLISDFYGIKEKLESHFEIRFERKEVYLPEVEMRRTNKLKRLFFRPRKGWETPGKGTGSLPPGVIGNAVMPTVISSMTNTAVETAKHLEKATPVLETTGKFAGAAGPIATGAAFAIQGALMEVSSHKVGQRLGRISKAKRGAFENARMQFKSRRDEPLLEQERNEKVNTVKSQMGPVLERMSALKIDLASEDHPASEKVKTELIESLDKMHEKLDLFEKQDVLEIYEIHEIQSILALIISITAYLKETFAENYTDTNSPVNEAYTAASEQLNGWDFVLNTSPLFKEIELTYKLETLASEVSEVKSAEIDNQVMRWTGRSYMAGGTAVSSSAGGSLVAASSTAAAVLTALGPVGLGVITLGYASNWINAKRNENRLAASELDIGNSAPYAPKNVGFHREMVAVQTHGVQAYSAAQVGMSDLLHGNVGWRSMGWGAATLAGAGLTTAATATAVTGGAALPVIVGVGAGLSIVLNTSVFNLFTQIGPRLDGYGPRPESVQQDIEAMDSNQRKKEYWDLNTQLGNASNHNFKMLRSIDKRNKVELGAAENLHPMQKGARSSLLKRKHQSLVETTDPRRGWGGLFFSEDPFSINRSRKVKVKAAEKIMKEDWETLTSWGNYSLQDYAEHELNKLRNIISTKIDSHQKASEELAEFSELGISQQGKLALYAEQDRNNLVEEIDRLKNRMEGIQAFIKRLEDFELKHVKDSKNYEIDLNARSLLEQNYRALISEFIVDMDYVGNIYDRKALLNMRKEFPGEDITVETYGRFRAHISDVKTKPKYENLSQAFKDKLEEDAFKNFANMMYQVREDTLKYKRSRLISIELGVRRPDSHLETNNRWLHPFRDRGFKGIMQWKRGLVTEKVEPISDTDSCSSTDSPTYVPNEENESLAKSKTLEDLKAAFKANEAAWRMTEDAQSSLLEI